MDQPQGPKLMSLREWAKVNGYSESHVLRNLPYERDDFPEPVSTRVIKRVERPEPIKLQGVKLNQEVNLARFIDLIGVSEHLLRQTMEKHPDPLPPVVREGSAGRSAGGGAPKQLRNLRDLRDWWNNRPGIVRGSVEERLYDPQELDRLVPKRPEPISLPDQDLNAEVSLNRFAVLIGVDGKTVSQYKQLDPDSMPSTTDGQRPDKLPPRARAKFKLGELLTWWNSRPGRVGRPVGYSPKKKSASSGAQVKKGDR